MAANAFWPRIMDNAQRWPERLLELLAALCFMFATFVAVRYAGQAPYDLHAFRQTQTALTAYWFLQDGFRLAYETPVGGYPWSIPFEFPIYQALVAGIAKVTGCHLEIAGRLLSYVFLCACVFPARQIVSKLALPRTVFLAFVALLFSSPVYLYWGRTFMIETAALFFAVAAIPFWLDMLKRPALRPALGFAVFSTLAILQKATTEIPLLGVLGAAWLWHLVRSSGTVAALWRKENLAIGMLAFIVPLAIGAAWVIYSDVIKSENPLGVQLTSRALNAWNWGRPEQRFSADLLVGALWKRLFEQNLGGYVGAFALCVGITRLPYFASSRTAVALCVAAGLLPLFLFSNLYIVHKYYLAANTMALLFGLSIVAGAVSRIRAELTLVGVTLVVALNLSVFVREYLLVTEIVFTARNSTEIAVGEVLQRETAPTQSFVAFGNDWSSSLAYASRRKSFTVAPFFARYTEAQEHPERFVGDESLGAVVACVPGANSALAAVLRWTADQGWTMGNVRGCYVAVAPKRTVPIDAVVDASSCEGDVVAKFNPSAGDAAASLVDVLGWVAGSHGRPDEVFVSVTDEAGSTSMRRAIRTPRSATADAFDVAIETSRLHGASHLRIIRQTGSAFERCPWVVDLPAATTNLR